MLTVAAIEIYNVALASYLSAAFKLLSLSEKFCLMRTRQKLVLANAIIRFAIENS